MKIIVLIVNLYKVIHLTSHQSLNTTFCSEEWCIPRSVKRWKNSYITAFSDTQIFFLSHTRVHVHKHPDSPQQTCAHMHMVARTHKWPHCRAISSSTPSWVSSDVSLIFFSLPLSSLSKHLRETTDGWRGGGESRRARREGGRVGGRGGECFLLSLFLVFFFYESKLNLNSVLPYADLQRNAPYAQKCIKQYRRQTLNETKY